MYVGFYVPWDESSTASLQRHIGDLDWLAPVWVTVTGPNHQFNVLPDRSGRAVINRAGHRPLILPVVQNFANGQVDKRVSRRCLQTLASVGSFLDQLEPFLPPTTRRAPCSISSNSIAPSQAKYLELLREARASGSRSTAG